MHAQRLLLAAEARRNQAQQQADRTGFARHHMEAAEAEALVTERRSRVESLLRGLPTRRGLLASRFGVP
jgi:hypothetical protein